MAVSSYALIDTGNPLLEARLRFMLSGEPRALSASENIGDMLGFTPADFLSSHISFRDRIHPHDNDIAEMLFGADLRDEPGTCNLRLRCADGQILCVRADFVKRRDPGSGEVVLDLCLQDAKSLNRNSPSQSLMANFTAMMENTDDIIFFKDRHHVYTAASRSLQNAVRPLLGGASLIGLTDYDILPEAEADAFYRPEKQIFAGADVARELQKVVLPSGETRWMDDWKYPIKNESGEILGLFAIARDITERVQVEETLRESEEALKEAQEIAGLGRYVLDIQTGDWASSDVLDALFGIERKSEHTLDEWMGLLHPEDREPVRAHFREMVASCQPFNREYRIVRGADQAVRWVHGLGRMECDVQGRPAVMAGTIQDITERKKTEATLRQSNELLRLFIEHAPAALAMLDREACYIAASHRWLDDFRLAGRDVIGRSHYELVPDLPARWKLEHLRVLAGESLRRDEDRFERADGTVQWLRRELIPWRLDNGDVGGIVIFSEDITLAKEAEHRLKLAASVFAHASEAIVITALDGAILDVNDTFTCITGYTRDEVLGRNLRVLKSGRQDREFYDTMWQSVLIDGHWSGEIWNRAKNGDLFAALETITTVFDAAGKPKHYVALLTDITPIKEQERKLEHIAHYDPLTGLPNRALLAESLRHAMVESQPTQLVAVVSFDLDSFKAVNDRYGRETGDALLAAVAYRTKRVIRESDTLARTGGDEFVAVLRHLENTDAAISAINRLLRVASEAAQIGDLELQVSASAGVTLYPQADDVDADQLLRQADRAMYQAKLDGKDRFHTFDATEDRTVRSHLEDVENLRRALAAREFVLHYQPRVNMASGILVGAEALIRWQHPRRGLLGPQMFLPVVEDHPLAVEIGDWVIDTAIGQMESWRAMGLNIPVSINICARQLQEPDFVKHLSALLEAHPDIEPASLELEVLETSALMDVALVSSHIEECRRLGVSVAIDDFGTGYSSLTYLKRLPTNVLKIDQSFIREMLNDPEDLAILEGVLGLASAFRRQAIAEGVETVEQGAMLLQLGCEQAQGYGIARPMPAEELPAWAAAWKPDPRWAGTQPVSPAEWPVLYGGVEHRAWLKLLEAFLRSERSAPPGLDAQHCRIGEWLLAESKGPRGAQPAFQQVAALHGRVHELAADAIAQKTADRAGEAQARLPELGRLVEEVLELLKALIRKG